MDLIVSVPELLLTTFMKILFAREGCVSVIVAFPKYLHLYVCEIKNVIYSRGEEYTRTGETGKYLRKRVTVNKA